MRGPRRRLGSALAPAPRGEREHSAARSRSVGRGLRDDAHAGIIQRESVATIARADRPRAGERIRERARVEEERTGIEAGDAAGRRHEGERIVRRRVEIAHQPRGVAERERVLLMRDEHVPVVEQIRACLAKQRARQHLRANRARRAAASGRGKCSCRRATRRSPTWASSQPRSSW